VSGARGGVPVVGNNVFIGHGVKILGNIVIGDYCFVCPGAVVLHSIEKGCTVAGMPARVLNENGMRNYKLYPLVELK
jgi:serine acetyltransferase